MRILAIDTATEACSVALLTDTGMIGEWREVGRGHAETLLPMIDAILAEGGMTLERLDAIAASIGPGAFTGVRISVAVAQGLAFGAGVPVIGVTTLEALALQAIGQGPDRAAHALVCLDARMAEVYWGCFSTDLARGVVARGIPAVAAAAAVAVPFDAACYGIGRGFAAYPILASLPGLILEPGAAAALPDARHMAQLAAFKLRLGEAKDPAELAPLYLRDKVAFTELERAAAKQAAQ